MSTFNDMVEEVQSHLRAYTLDQEMSTHLLTSVTSTDDSITVNDASIVSRGRIQIDDEIIWVDSTDRSTGVLSIPPYGRGMDGSTAAAHTSGTRVVIQPKLPTKRVKEAINQVIASLAGTLYGISTEQMEADSSSPAYELPEDCAKVVSVAYEYDSTIYQDTEYLRRWKFDPNAQYTTSSTGKALYIYDGLAVHGLWSFVGGNYGTITVTYLTDPKQLSGNEAFSKTGLPDSCYDVVILGAAARLLSMVAAGNVTNRAVEANMLDSRIGADAALQQVRYLQTLYMQRLQDEQFKMNDLFANRSHYTG